MRLPEQRKALAEKLERYVYSNIISRNPALKLIEVEHGDDIDLTSFPHIRIQNDGDEPRSYTKRTIDTRGLTTYRGAFITNGAEFCFSLNRQNPVNI